MFRLVLVAVAAFLLYVNAPRILEWADSWLEAQKIGGMTCETAFRHASDVEMQNLFGARFTIEQVLSAELVRQNDREIVCTGSVYLSHGGKADVQVRVFDSNGRPMVALKTR